MLPPSGDNPLWSGFDKDHIPIPHHPSRPMAPQTGWAWARWIGEGTGKGIDIIWLSRPSLIMTSFEVRMISSRL